MAAANATPFAAAEAAPGVSFAPGTVSHDAENKPDLNTAGSAKSFKLVASPSGKDLYVEAKEYDPLAPHRPRDSAANKGEGLGFMFSCFRCCGAPEEEDKYEEKAATAERHYSLPPSASAQNLKQE